MTELLTPMTDDNAGTDDDALALLTPSPAPSIWDVPDDAPPAEGDVGGDDAITDAPPAQEEETDEVEEPLPASDEPETGLTVPGADKFVGKTPDEIAQMFKVTQAEYTRKAQEAAEYRKLVEAYQAAQATPDPAPADTAQPSDPLEDTVMKYANEEYKLQYAAKRVEYEAMGMLDDEGRIPDFVNQAITVVALEHGKQRAQMEHMQQVAMAQLAPAMIQQDVTQLLPATNVQYTTAEEVSATLTKRMAEQGISPAQWQSASPQERATAVNMVALQLENQRLLERAAATPAPKAKPPAQRVAGTPSVGNTPAAEKPMSPVMAQKVAQFKAAFPDLSDEQVIAILKG